MKKSTVKTRPRAARKSRIVSTAAAEKKQPGHAGLNRVRRPLFPVAGIGFAAGGLEAVEQFFSSMTSSAGMTFVIIANLKTDYRNRLKDILARHTNSAVVPIEDGTAIQPNSIYLAPRDREVGIIDGTLYLFEPSHAQARKPIDHFLKSLAKDRGPWSVGIILSGTGSDGTAGFEAIKQHGGTTLAQSPETARHEAMPAAAIETGFADFVLPAGEMPATLLSYTAEKAVPRNESSPDSPELNDTIRKILLLIRNHTGHDFSQYKPNTLFRQLQKRMAARQIGSIREYIRLLQAEETEVEGLFEELLIGATGFFRDPETFEALREKAFPLIFDSKSFSESIRVWVPGCSTGEEAYSLAILFREYMQETRQSPDIQIFATDINTRAIETARQARYPEQIARDVSEKRLERFFTKTGRQYRIRKEIRDMVIFSVQNILSDPPFPKLDMISCRNLLILLRPEAQHRIIPRMHAAMRTKGVLFLGISENTAPFEEPFAVLDRKCRIYLTRETRAAARRMFSAKSGPRAISRTAVSEHDRHTTLDTFAKKVLLNRFSPPCVIIDQRNDIVYLHGNTGMFLEQAERPSRKKILEIARDGIREPLASALPEAFETKKQKTLENLAIGENGGNVPVHVFIQPLTDPDTHEPLMLIVFQQAG